MRSFFTAALRLDAGARNVQITAFSTIFGSVATDFSDAEAGIILASKAADSRW